MVKSDYDSVGEFHKKFDLPTQADGPPRELTLEEFEFRTKFLLEELKEFCEGFDVHLEARLVRNWSTDSPKLTPPQDLPKMADALIDLAYVCLGTAQMMRLPWAALFADVQRANMTKERCGIDHVFSPPLAQFEPPQSYACAIEGCGRPRAEHSLRGSALDVIKPEGWTGPSTHEILLRAGWNGPALPLEGE